MDIRAALASEHSRAMSERIAAHVSADTKRFAILMDLVLRNEPVISQRAAYSMSLAVEAHPALIVPYLKDLLSTLDKPVHEAVQRNTIRLLQFCELPKPLHGRIAQKMLDRVADPAWSIAQRAFAITVAMRLVKLYPELTNELELLLEDALLVDPGPAIRSRATKALKILHKKDR